MKAVAAGAASLAPFFDERSGLGRDADVRSRPARGGLQQGDTPGLYGGTGKASICDVARLKRYLAEPRNDRKARAWAGALDLRKDEIPGYLDGLTPVLLRHDTLVRNHDYKKGKAVPFNALLQAGIAILVDDQGMPAVKCSCGNPLRPFEGDRNRISVSFDDGNERWKGYDRSEVVVVRPASHELKRIALVDVEDPGRGIERPVGTAGEEDTAFDTRKRRAVPSLIGTTFGEASRRLAGRGLAVAYDGEDLPPDGARVTASDPAAGAELRFGTHVTLSVVRDESPSGGGTTPPDPEPSRPTTSPASPSAPSEPSSPSSPSEPSSPSSGPSRSERPASPSGTSDAPSTPAGSAPPPPPSTSSGPAPPSTRSAPPEPPGTTSVPPRTTPPPPTGGPASSAPATSVPATSEAPTTSAPAERPRRTRE
ncbi:PASTA domain-containing protein [Streptomyces sp. NRRL S-37]|uniref:PASTA domain-containing protein n=1 Tax=Streptomyces sp. NRRL S-37 TaxID=1463903 RepID=UPI002D21E903|nr:PASTA domain-containing protein [Streptomyces sp. NRRL S-37]